MVSECICPFFRRPPSIRRFPTYFDNKSPIFIQILDIFVLAKKSATSGFASVSRERICVKFTHVYTDRTETVSYTVKIYMLSKKAKAKHEAELQL